MACFLCVAAGCGAMPGALLPNESTRTVNPSRYELASRFVHLTDAQIVDEQSPARLTFGARFSPSAWRPQEAYSIQLLDGMVRTVNKMHVAEGGVDFVLFTGDATDNAQLNELHWFIQVFNGGFIDPRSGPDDRDPALRPDPLLDPHEPFPAQGLYRQGIHGPLPTIAWYSVMGNHDRFAMGVFPIVTGLFGRRTAPLPREDRPGLFFPTALEPTGSVSWAPVTPARPGPPEVLNLPMRVVANPDRRYITERDFVGAHLQAPGRPAGHGFSALDWARTWYSTAVAPGVRLIGLNTATPILEFPGQVYSEGAVSLRQARFLRRELEAAQGRGDAVIVATHHPSDSLPITNGTSLISTTFRRLLNSYSCVKLHLAGHWHANVVFDRGGYVEIVTGSVIDAPQQGRVIELWRRVEAADEQTGGAAERDDDVALRYWLFSHLDVIGPGDDEHIDVFDDPLRPMRRVAAELAGVDTGSMASQRAGAGAGSSSKGFDVGAAR